MAKVWLQADVQEASNGQHLINDGVADGRVNIRSDEEILNCLQQFHGEKEENTAG